MIREGVERQGKCSFFHRICTWDSVHGALSVQEMQFGPPYTQCHIQGGWQVGFPSPWRPHAELPNSNNSCSELMPVASCPHWWKYFLGTSKCIRMRRGASLVVSTRPLIAKSSNFVVSSEHLPVRISRKQKDWATVKLSVCLSYLLLFISRVWIIINMRAWFLAALLFERVYAKLPVIKGFRA